MVRAGVAPSIAAALLVHASAIGQAGEIAVLSEAAYTEAIACGRSGRQCAVEPYLLCPQDLEPYTARLATPFSRVAGSVYEAVSRQQRVRPMSEDAANGWGIGIYVIPAASVNQADVIQNVTLVRGDRTIAPTTVTLAPVMARAVDGTSKQLAKGFFAFPADAFAPTADTTIVFTGSSGEARCSLTASKLAALR